jgi:post-segregation antitoxin (ccd killing protein)
VQTQLSNKHNLVLYVDQELVEKTRELGFNLSKVFENHLKEVLTQFSHVNTSNNFDNRDNASGWCGRRGSNPGSQAWKACVLTS